MNRGRFDHLFTTTQAGAQSWLERTTDAERKWFEDLVDAVIEWGMDPNWKAAVDDFTVEFGEDRAPASTTLAKHTRAAVKARADGK